MNPSERIKCIIEGKEPDRPAFSAWGHIMNFDDGEADSFTRATIDAEELYRFDFIKAMPNPYYMIEDMGLKKIKPLRYDQPVTRDNNALPIRKPADFLNIPFSEAGKGAFLREEKAIRKVEEHFNGTVPVLPTIFSPILYIQYLAITSDELQADIKKYGNSTALVERYLSENKDVLYPMLEKASEVNKAFMNRLADAGVAGFFYASEHTDGAWSSREAFECHEGRFIREELDSVKDKTYFNVLHVCGTKDVKVDWVKDYPVQALNWASLSPDNPSMEEVRRYTDKVLVGGIDERMDLKGNDEKKIQKTLVSRLQNARKAAGSKLVLSGGCVFDIEDSYRFTMWRDLMSDQK